MTLNNLKNNIVKSDENFWNSRYESGQTGWDIGEVSVPVREYADQLKDKTARILIPGCGNAYEAAYLSSAGFSNITLLDLSGVLMNKLEKYLIQTKTFLLLLRISSNMKEVMTSL